MSSAPSLLDGPWQLEIHDDLPSTADLLARRAASGAPDGLAILAMRQSAGRGTQGRPWASLPGNLFLSALVRPVAPLREAPRWALLAAVALAETVVPLLADRAALSLKWPNDLLLGGAKLAGILTETNVTADGTLGYVAIGVGVNLAAAPALPDRPTASLAGAGITPPAPADFARNLLHRLALWRGILETDGFEPVRAAWLRYGPAEGEPILVRRAAKTLSGQFAGLSPDGALLLRNEGGLHAIVSGELAFGPAVAAVEGI